MKRLTVTGLKLKALELPKEQSEKIEREISRLASMPPMMAESAVIRNYLDWIFDLPWHQESKDNFEPEKGPENSGLRSLWAG